VSSLWQRLSWLAGRVFAWPLVPLRGRWAAAAASVGVLLAVLLSRLLLMPAGAWEQDEALMACGVVDFDPARHMPLPPGFPLWVFIGKAFRKLVVHDPLQALQVASALASVAGVWALVGLWDRVATRRLALAGAALAAFLPGVWFHAARGFSGTPAAALAVVGFAMWLRAGRTGFVPGVIALTCAALVRPPLAPFFLLAVLCAAWGVRREPRRLLGGAAAGIAVLVVTLVPTALAAGGWTSLVNVTEVHAAEHLATLGTESWAPASLGLVRGLGTPATATLFLVLAMIGWWHWRRELAQRWWPATVAGLFLAFILVFMDNRNYPRYWVLMWMLLATPAVAGAATLGRSRKAALVATGVALGASLWWTYPAVRTIHRTRLPIESALAAVAAEPGGVLIFEDQLFSFRNLARMTGRLPAASLRLTEVPHAHFVAGNPMWLLAEGAGEDLASPTSRVVEFACTQPHVVRLSQDRFLRARLVRSPVLVTKGGFPVEFAGLHRFAWCGAHSVLLVPPVSGSGTLALAVDVHHRVRNALARARVEGQLTWSARLDPGPRIIPIPVPRQPSTKHWMRVALDVEREASSQGDTRVLTLRILGAFLAAPPHVPKVLSFFPERDSLLSGFADADGVFGPELIGNPPLPAAWTGARATLRFPVSYGMVGLELFAPRPQPARVEVRLGSSTAKVTVGPTPTWVALPVPQELVNTGWAQLELLTSTEVPGGRDIRALGVAVARVWYVPAPPVLALAR
jgi:hypothetical protein